MATYDMGFFIRQIRRERGITQEQLCRGLCSISTLSKIERGQYTPPGYLFRTLMERLGNYYGKYYSVFLNKDDFEMWQKMESINNALIQNNEELAESLISKHWGTKGFDEELGLQFMLNCKISLAVIKEERAKTEHEIANTEYVSTVDYDEWFNIAQESLRITIPDFDESMISEYMLSYEEIRAALCLMASYFFKKEYEKAAGLLYSLAQNLDKFCLDKLEKARYYPAILSNLAETMYELKRYDEAISVCVNGQNFCIESGRAREIPLFMSFHGKSLVEKGDEEEGKALLRQTYCVALALGQMELAKKLDSYFLKIIGEELKLCHNHPKI